MNQIYGVLLIPILFAFSGFVRQAEAAVSPGVANLENCIRATETKKCQAGKTGPSAPDWVRFPTKLKLNAVGKMIPPGDPSFGNPAFTTTEADGCYSLDFAKKTDGSGLDAAGKCKGDPKFPLRLTLRWYTTCADPSVTECVEGASVTVRPELELDQMTSAPGGFVFTPAVPFSFNSKVLVYQAKEACENMPGSFFKWDDAAQICRKPAKYICQDELKLNWDNPASDDMGKCEGAFPTCASLGQSCGSTNAFCNGVTYVPEGLQNGVICHCTGTSTTRNAARVCCYLSTDLSCYPTTTTTSTSTTTTI